VVSENSQENTLKIIGAKLKQMREGMGFSAKDIADKLYITPSTISSIEMGDCDLKAVDVFTKGYIRSYAKLVGLPEDEIDAEFKRIGLKSADSELTAIQVKRPQQITLKDKRVKTTSYLIAGLIILLFLIWWSVHHNDVNNDALITKPVAIEDHVIPQDMNISSTSSDTSSQVNKNEVKVSQPENKAIKQDIAKVQPLKLSDTGALKPTARVTHKTNTTGTWVNPDSK
jgi:cytoskeletal protein RodZ